MDDQDSLADRQRTARFLATFRGEEMMDDYDYRELCTQLRRSLQTWTSLLIQYTDGHRVDPQLYQQKYDELLSLSQKLRKHAGPLEADLCQRVTDHVRPWVSCHVLEMTDREILVDLVQQCQELERELGGSRGTGRIGRVLIILFMALVGAAAGLMPAEFGPAVGESYLNWLTRRWYRMQRFLEEETTQMEWGIGLGILGVVIAMLLVSRCRSDGSTSS
jgi:hypothetical protein